MEKKKSPKILGGKMNKSISGKQIGYYAYCCDRKAKYCLRRELKSRFNGDFKKAQKWMDKKRDLLDLRDQLLDFIEPDCILREPVQIYSEDIYEEYPPIIVDILFLCYRVGDFYLFRKEFDSSYEDELPYVSEDHFGYKGYDTWPVVNPERCERVLERLWK